MANEAEKAKARRTERLRYLAHLDKRIPELQASGQFPGRLARDEADREYRRDKAD
jgi:hypothetical protein